MKKVVFLASIAILALTTACNQGAQEGDAEVTTDLVNNPATAADGEGGEEKLPGIEFEEEVIEFGEISQGEKVKRRFRFKNTGTANLIISDAKGSCGCTVPLWPKQPIRPGQEGEIEVVFDSNGKQGRQHKTVTLVTNAIPNKTVIAIKGDVLVPESNTAQ